MNRSEPEDDLRDVLQPIPASAPADIDVTIRAHARQALDTASDSEIHPEKSSVSRLLRTLPMAAVVVLAIGLIPRMQQEPESRVIEPAPSTPQSDESVTTDSLDESAAEPQGRIVADSEAISNAGATSLAPSAYAQQQPGEGSLQQRQAMKEVDAVDAEIRARSPSTQPIESKIETENDQAPERAQSAFRDILELLRTGNDDSARIAYKRWRQAWPGVESIQDIEGMSTAEVSWFEGAAKMFEQSR